MNLDDTLAAWAESVRLPDAMAAQIQQRIIATPRPATVGPALSARASVPSARASGPSAGPARARPTVADPAGPPDGTIVGQPGLDPRWWRRFTAELTAGLVASTRPVSWTV